MNKHFFLVLIIFSVGHLTAQQRFSTSSISTSISKPESGKFFYASDRMHEAARAVVFSEQTIATTDFLSDLNSYFNIADELSFEETQSNTDNLGMQHRFMQQKFRDIPLEGLGYRIHEKNGFVTSANGKAIIDIKLDINTTLSEQQAFALAVQYLKTQDTVFRSGKKLIVSKNFTYRPGSFYVAYQFDIEVSFIERWRISIDARTGQAINKVSLVNTCLAPPPPPQFGKGTGLTNYFGNKTISVEKRDNGDSWMHGESENGARFGVRDFGNADILKLIVFPDYTHGPMFSSTDSIFDDPYEQAAVSVHWALEETIDYYFTHYNRNSYNNWGTYIGSYVHVGEDWDNAVWTGKVLAFGDGSTGNPPVELDIVSHEFTHAVTEHEAELIYTFESGALNESFSDIFAKAVEFTLLGNEATWQLGRNFRNGGIRNMSNPNLKNQPDTYLGDMWYEGNEDNGGVHINSGVQNYWFYLLCEGGSGVNDHGTYYDITSIGMDTTANIAYRNLTEYLIPTSDYLDCRIGSLLATADLYGYNSTVYTEVDKAWDAVGVIDEPIITSLDYYDITATTAKLNGSLLPRGDTVTYHFEYGTTPAFGDSSSIYNYTGDVEGIIAGLQSETKYYVRLVATNENGNSYAATELTTISPAPLVKIKNTIDVTDTSAILYGEINPNSLSTSFYFEYGPTPDMDLVTPTYTLSDTTEFLDLSVPVAGLQPHQTYYYKLIATNNFDSSETDSVSFFTALKPIISAFTPVMASPGGEITITGQNFNPTPEKNCVYFGATRGKVLSSNTSEIKVEVPEGASFGSISLGDTESGLSTKSVQEFVPTFEGEFGKGSLQLSAAYDDFSIHRLVISDMDGDGRPDIITSHNDGVTIFQNANTGGDITNASFVQMNAINNQSFNLYSVVDFDGNGLKDIVGNHQGEVWIYFNHSVPGYIFFSAPVELPFGNGRLRFNDFDNDGRIDIAVIGQLSEDSTSFTIFRNKNPKGSLSPEGFKLQYSKIFPSHYFNFDITTIGDLNNNGFSELLFSYYGEDFFGLLKNQSSPGNIEFEEIIFQDSIRLYHANYIAQDLNMDGWKDIASLSSRAKKMSIYENKGPDIDLSKPIEVLDRPSGSSFYLGSYLQPGDMNGDGKVDLIIGINGGRFILFKNNMEVGEPISESSFEIFDQYGYNISIGETVNANVFINDLNGDGRPEVISDIRYSSNANNENQLEIWQNMPNVCVDPSLITVNAERTSANIVLPPNTISDQFEIEYALSGTNDWLRTTSTLLENLSPDTSYKLRIRGECEYGFTSQYYSNFTTLCVDLPSFSISDIQTERVTPIASHGISDFEIEYTAAGEENWKTHYRWYNSISGLSAGTTYNLRYRGRCSSTQEFTYTQFTTLCPTLKSLNIAELVFDKAVLTWENDYDSNLILEYSEDNISWKSADESGEIYPLIPGKEYFVRGSLACRDIHSDYVYTSIVTPCPKASGLTVDAVTPFSAHINWDDESNTGSYIIKYSEKGREIKTETINSTSFYLDDLTPGTDYSVSVAPECIGNKDFTSIDFTTVCYAPYNLTADIISHTAAELSWESDFDGPLYTFEYAILGSEEWQVIQTDSFKVTLEALRPGTKYHARVRITCLDEMAPYASMTFQTNLYGETVLAPNPTENTVTIYPSKDLIGNSFSIFDESGREMSGGTLLDYTFDLSGFIDGIYILKIEGEETMKIVKQ